MAEGFAQILHGFFSSTHHAVQNLHGSATGGIRQGDLPGGKAQFCRGIGSHGAVLHSLHQFQHGLTARQRKDLLCTHLRHGADGVQHFPAGDTLGGKDKGVRGDTLAQQGNTIPDGLFSQRDQGYRLAVLIDRKSVV